jgi:dihydropteroate synthase
MGIVNVTPDSFSDGGLHAAPEAAAAHARQLVAEGADVLDLGAESTRPGHAPVSTTEELARLLPALHAIRAALPDTPVSVDTCKAEVAAAAVAAGADIINDIWGGLLGAEGAEGGHSPMCAAAARTAAPLILMHNRATPAPDAVFWETFLGDMRTMLALARDAGVPDSQIWLDPGFGFGKTPAQNLECLRHLDRLAQLGFPVLLGTSRKSTLGLVLGGAPVHERLDADKAAAAWGVSHGAAMVRVHDVAAYIGVLRMADAIKSGLGWRSSRRF